MGASPSASSRLHMGFRAYLTNRKRRNSTRKTAYALNATWNPDAVACDHGLTASGAGAHGTGLPLRRSRRVGCVFLHSGRVCHPVDARHVLRSEAASIGTTREQESEPCLQHGGGRLQLTPLC